MIKINLVAAAERARLEEHERHILETKGGKLIAARRLTRAEAITLRTRILVEGWTVARAAHAAGVTKQAAYYILRTLRV